jgi:hypothetical protein
MKRALVLVDSVICKQDFLEILGLKQEATTCTVREANLELNLRPQSSCPPRASLLPTGWTDCILKVTATTSCYMNAISQVVVDLRFSR